MPHKNECVFGGRFLTKIEGDAATGAVSYDQIDEEMQKAMIEIQGDNVFRNDSKVNGGSQFLHYLTVDGQNRDLVNIWRGVEVDAGDFLIFRLEFCEEEPRTRHMFVLNHINYTTQKKTNLSPKFVTHGSSPRGPTHTRQAQPGRLRCSVR